MVTPVRSSRRASAAAGDARGRAALARRDRPGRVVWRKHLHRVAGPLRGRPPHGPRARRCAQPRVRRCRSGSSSVTAPVPMLRSRDRDLAPGLYAIEGPPRTWRYENQGWTIVTDAAETATIADYGANPPLLQRKRLRLVRLRASQARRRPSRCACRRGRGRRSRGTRPQIATRWTSGRTSRSIGRRCGLRRRPAS